MAGQNSDRPPVGGYFGLVKEDQVRPGPKVPNPAERRSGSPLVPHRPGCRGRSPEGKDVTNPMESL